jgi:hypothetical protein
MLFDAAVMHRTVRMSNFIIQLSKKRKPKFWYHKM